MLVTRDHRGVYTLTLNRPAQHNALNAGLVDALTDRLRHIDDDPGTRVVVITGAGDTFCSGGDLEYFQSLSAASEETARGALEQLAELYKTTADLHCPTLARVQGPAFGGGVGLIAACDIAIASDAAVLAIPELALGLIPALIAPYLISAIGMRATRSLSLSGERVSARTAQRLGLLHEVVRAPELDAAVTRRIAALFKAAPGASANLKRMLKQLSRLAATDTVAALMARLRDSPESAEGIAAFLAKRKPGWQA